MASPPGYPLQHPFSTAYLANVALQPFNLPSAPGTPKPDNAKDIVAFNLREKHGATVNGNLEAARRSLSAYFASHGKHLQAAAGNWQKYFSQLPTHRMDFVGVSARHREALSARLLRPLCRAASRSYPIPAATAPSQGFVRPPLGGHVPVDTGRRRNPTLSATEQLDLAMRTKETLGGPPNLVGVDVIGETLINQ